MGLVLTSGPASEPVTVAEAKAHLRVDGAAEDLLIGSLILTSRLHIEMALGLALITQGWTLVLDRWPGAEVEFPLRPLQSVTAVRVLAADASASLIDPESYRVDATTVPPRLVRTGPLLPEPGQAFAGIEIDFTAGFGASAANVPAPIRQALLQLVAHWYEHRDPIEIGSQATVLPAALTELLTPYRVAKL